MRAAEAIGITILTLALIIGRPRDLNEGWAAVLGGLLTLGLLLVPLGEAVRLELSNWNVFLFFLGMMATAGLADQSGAFDQISFVAARLAGGRVVLLYAAVFLTGALISLFFANDSAALVLTPIVYTLVVQLALDPLPFVFATTFIADTASVGLPVSNPLNVIMASSFHLTLLSYVSHLWLAALVVIVLNVAAFYVIFRHGIRGHYPPLPPPEPRPAIVSSLVILGVLALAYLLASATLFPLGIVALAGALALAVNLYQRHALDWPRLGREISWPIFGFIGGMLLVVQGLADSGVTGALGETLVRAGAGSSLAAIAAAAAGTALGSNLINNLPMALLMRSTIAAVHVSGPIRLDMVYATILGADLGPNLTHLGSLATFLWLFFLRRKGLDVSTWDYFRIGVLVMPLMLAGAILALWLTSAGL